MADLQVDRILPRPSDEPLLRPKTLLAHPDPDPEQDLDHLPYDKDHIRNHGRLNHEDRATDLTEVQVEQEAGVQVATQGDRTESEATAVAPIIHQEGHRAQRLWWKS